MLHTISHRPEEGCVLRSALLLRHAEASGGVSRKCHEPSPVTQMLAPLCHAVTDSLSTWAGWPARLTAAPVSPCRSASSALLCSASSLPPVTAFLSPSLGVTGYQSVFLAAIRFCKIAMQKLPEVVGICDSKCWAEAERCSQDCWEIGPINEENIPNTILPPLSCRSG